MEFHSRRFCVVHLRLGRRCGKNHVHLSVDEPLIRAHRVGASHGTYIIVLVQRIFSVWIDSLGKSGIYGVQGGGAVHTGQEGTVVKFQCGFLVQADGFRVGGIWLVLPEHLQSVIHGRNVIPPDAVTNICRSCHTQAQINELYSLFSSRFQEDPETQSKQPRQSQKGDRIGHIEGDTIKEQKHPNEKHRNAAQKKNT